MDKKELDEEKVLETEEHEKNEERESEVINELLKEKDVEIEELKDKLLRLQADFVNYKNRASKDKESTILYATEDLLTQILPILDNFERALESVGEEDAFYQGVKMIYEQLLKILKDNGLEEISCIGESFDPNFHHAVFMEECENSEEGTILEVFQKGYKLNDRVIRPSMVKVAK